MGSDTRSGWSAELADGRRCRVVMTDRHDGDLAVGDPDGRADARRRRVIDLPWTWLHQVHGADVVHVSTPGELAGSHADGAVTATSSAVLAAHVADCAPVALIDGSGAGIAVVHAGWRGLAAGIIEQAAVAMGVIGARPTVAVLGACIGPDAYEFGEADLDHMADRFGSAVRATTAHGTPALDMAAAVTAALTSVGISTVDRLGGCTAAEADLRWSHRARGDRERQAMLVWLEPGGAA